MVRVLAFLPLVGSFGGLIPELLSEAGSFVLRGNGWQLDDPSEQSGWLRAADSFVADQQFLVERLVDLPPLLRVAAAVELAKVVEQRLPVDEIQDGALERLVELPSLMLDASEGLLDTVDLGPEEVGRELVVVVELQQLLAFVHELVALLVQPLMVSLETDLAVGQGLFDQDSQFSDLMGVQGDGVVEPLDVLLDGVDVEVALRAVVAVLVPTQAEKVFVGAAAAVGDLDAVAGLALQAEDGALQVVRMLAVFLPSFPLCAQDLADSVEEVCRDELVVAAGVPDTSMLDLAEVVAVLEHAGHHRV